MNKLKKFERVTDYLKKLKKDGETSDTDLMKLHYRDLMGLPELRGIGDRTISNALKAFKKELGVLPQKEVISKRQRVRNYLDEQLKSGAMSIDELMELRFQDLMGRDPLKGIGKTTISCTLSVYKKNYEKSMFESNILSFLDKERATEDVPGKEDVAVEPEPTIENAVSLTRAEISLLRQMMDQYQENMFKRTEQKDGELEELKLALNFSGIDGQRILELYWKSRNEVVVPIANLIQGQRKDYFSIERA